MLNEAGFKIARVAQIPWEDRKNVDGWPSRAGAARQPIGFEGGATLLAVSMR